MKSTVEEQASQLLSQPEVKLVIANEQSYEEEISLGEIFGLFWAGRKIIALITLVAFMISSLGLIGVNFILQDKVGKVENIISFNFDGIKQGRNPDGGVFDITEFTSKEVLEETITELNLPVSAEKLKENIEIKAVVPAEIQQQMALITQMAEKDVSYLEQIPEIKYNPTQYHITLMITKEMGIEDQEAEHLLNTLVTKYTEYFMDTYSDKELLSTAVVSIDPSEYDYSEYILMVDNTLKDIQMFLEDYIKSAGEYRAKSTGLSFEEIEGQVELLRTIEVNNAQAMIHQFMITRDRERLISVYSNNIETLQVDLAEQQNILSSVKDATTQYQKDSLVVMGQEAGAQSIQVETNSEMYDQLMQEALDVEFEIQSIQYDIAYYQDLLAKLVNHTVDTESNMDRYVGQVDTSIEQIQEKMMLLIETINETIEEYYNTELFKNSVQRDMPSLYQSFTMDTITDSVLGIVIAVLLGGVLGSLYVLSVGMMGTQKKDREGK